jgi:hypothetical protein
MSNHALAGLMLFSAATAAQPVEPPQAGCGEIQQPAIVYTRQPRSALPIRDLDGNVVYASAAAFQDFYDFGQPDTFTETDIILDDQRGNTATLYNCTQTSAICSAHEMRISPDATRGVFTVAHGKELHGTKSLPANKYQLPLIEFEATQYQLFLYDFVDNSTTLLDSNARMADWLDNDHLVFASDRADTWPPYAAGGRDYKSKGLHIYRAEIRDKKLGPAFDLMPHAVSCMSPAVNPDGTIPTSCWNGFGDRAVFPSTSLNLIWVEQINSDGTNHRVIMGGHRSATIKARTYLEDVCGRDDNNNLTECGDDGTAWRVLRGYVPLRDDKFAIINYYRTNHAGQYGTALICSRSDAEGYSQSRNLVEATHPSSVKGSGQFTNQCFVATPFAMDTDKTAKRHKNGRLMGKVGHVFPVPADKGLYGFTWTRGDGYSIATPAQSNLEFTGGEPTAQRRIMLAHVPRVTDPFDGEQATCIAGCEDDDRWNVFDARYVSNYQTLYGVPSPPPPLPIAEGTTSKLIIANARQGELHKLTGPNYKPWMDCSIQGCADDDWKERIAAIHIERVLPWRTAPDRQGFFATEPVGTFPLEPSGRVEIDIPCNMTYQLWGVDEDNNIVTRDHSLHPSVCGEVAVCAGCHDQHSEESKQ